MTTSYASLFGTTGSGTKSGIGSLFGQTATAKSSTPTYQQTFSEMQKAGQARPAPPAPTAGTYGTYAGSAQAQEARAPMLDAVKQQLAQPTRYDTTTFNAIRDAAMGDLTAQYARQREGMDESLARRGLYDSSIAANQYRDLGAAQSRDVANLNAQLLREAATTQAQDRLAAMQAAGQFAEMAGSQDLSQFEANRVGQAQSFQEALQAAMFGQGQSEFDRSQALQAAQLEQTGGMSYMDLALREMLGMGQLGLGAAELGERGRQFDLGQGLTREQMQQQQGQFESDLNLRTEQLMQQAALEGRSLDLQEARDLAGQAIERERMAQQYDISQQDIDLRARSLMQDAQLQGRSLDLQEARDLASRTLERERLTQQGTQFDSDLAQRMREMTQRGTQFDMDLELRRLLGTGELDVRRTESQANLQMQQNALMMQLAQALSGMSPEMLRRLFGGGDTPPPQTTSTPPPGSIPGTPDENPDDPGQDRIIP